VIASQLFMHAIADWEGTTDEDGIFTKRSQAVDLHCVEMCGLGQRPFAIV
jgi:hypothetical protein